MSVKAPISNISKCSLHDGPGVRTVIYLKGCDLRCRWCHNPETISFKKQILFSESKCIGCGRCVEICPTHHKVSGNSLIFLRDGCKGCGKCAEKCPALALSVCGDVREASEVFEDIKKDVHYYTASGGGVTFSGGECLLHPEFVREVAGLCKENGIHTAIESAMHVPFKNVEAVLPLIDLFYVDLKIPSPEKHLEYTGRDNALIIDNIRRLSYLSDNVILRIPVIPGVNDSDNDTRGFAEIIKSFGSGIKSVELLKYNNLAEGKYLASGQSYVSFADSPQSNGKMEALRYSLSEKCGRHCFFV